MSDLWESYKQFFLAYQAELDAADKSTGIMGFIAGILSLSGLVFGLLLGSWGIFFYALVLKYFIQWSADYYFQVPSRIGDRPLFRLAAEAHVALKTILPK